MGYPTTSFFDITFIERTKDNLNNFNGDNNFTNLINNVIGLIFIPHEYNNKGIRKNLTFLKAKIKDIPEIDNILVNMTVKVSVDGKIFSYPIFKYIKDNIEVKKEDLDISTLLRLIRNSFAHANIIPFGDDKIWKGIIIKNYQSKKEEKKDNYNFILTLERIELQKLAITIANLYLNEVKQVV